MSHLANAASVNEEVSDLRASRSRTTDPPRSAAAHLRAGLYAAATETLARLIRTPQYIILFVSDQCWMRCSHCWFNEEFKQNELTAPALSFAEYEALAGKTRVIAFLSITGGEAFQRPDIAELVTMFRKTTQLGRYQIPTSGYRTAKIVADTEKMLRDNPRTPFRVDVSLDGVGSVHNGIRRIRDGFEHAVDTIRALNALRRHFPHFDVGIITTISKQNQDSLTETADFVERIHPDGEWMINIARGNGRDKAAVEVDPAIYRRAHELIDERIERGAYRGHGGHWSAKWLSAKNAARREIIHEIITGRRKGGGCAAGALAGVIQSDGTVKACEMLDEHPLGNLRDHDYDLAALWRAAAAKQVRGLIQRTGCQCTQECFLSTSMLLSPDAWVRMIKARHALG